MKIVSKKYLTIILTMITILFVPINGKAKTQEIIASLSNMQNMGNKVWFDVTVKNTSNYKNTVYIIVYAKNDSISPPRRSAWPAPGILFGTIGTKRGRLSISDISEYWNSGFAKNAKAVLSPGESETIPAVLSLNRCSTLSAWHGKCFETGSMYNEWYLWIFSEDGQLIYKKTYK